MATQNSSATVQFSDSLIMLTSDIVASYVTHNTLGVDEENSLIKGVYTSLSGLGETAE